jgi:transposase InsO family protein
MYCSLENSCGKVILANGGTMVIKGRGTVFLTTKSNYRLKLENVLWIPELKDPLISVRALRKSGFKIEFDENKAYIYRDEQLLATGDEHPKEYRVTFYNFSEKAFPVTETDFRYWHERFGHPGKSRMMRLIKECNLDISEPENFKCDECFMGKQVRKPFPTSQSQTNQPGQLIHSDTCGPFRGETINRSRYFITFLDDYTKYAHVAILQNKEAATVNKAFMEFVVWFERQSGFKIKKFRSDQGNEYYDIWKTLSSNGIEKETSVRYTPQQNGAAERLNRTLLDMTRSLLATSKLESKYWSELVLVSAHLFNRCPRISSKTPMMMLKSKSCMHDLKYLRKIGCKAQVLKP